MWFHLRFVYLYCSSNHGLSSYSMTSLRLNILDRVTQCETLVLSRPDEMRSKSCFFWSLNGGSITKLWDAKMVCGGMQSWWRHSNCIRGRGKNRYILITPRWPNNQMCSRVASPPDELWARPLHETCDMTEESESWRLSKLCLERVWTQKVKTKSH